MKKHIQAEIIKKEQIKNDLFKFTIEASEIIDEIKPGQFIEIRVINSIEPLLRRPISIYNVNKIDNTIEFIFQVKGKGTKILAEREIGGKLDIVGPLGNGVFTYEDNKNVAIIGGGIGIFPLYELSKQIKNNTNSNVNMYIGFRSKDYIVLEKEFSEVSNNLVITTDDGSYGIKGFAINELKKDIEKGKIDVIYACGPLPMLKAVKELAKEKTINCQISLEEKMACGLGVCLGCAVKTASSTIEEPKYLHVCKDGPVFNAEEVDI